MREAIKGVARGHQWPSVALSGPQWPSVPIRGNQRRFEAHETYPRLELLMPIRGNPRQSEAIRGVPAA